MMNIKKFLPSHLAFTKGADLWIISDPQHSFWSRLIDWYLGFKFHANRHQLSLKPLNHSPLSPSIVEEEIPQLKTHPILLESSQRLPNLWTLETCYCSQWVKSIYKIWSDLNRPRVRVFIPKPLTQTMFENQWFQLSQQALIQYVVEKNP